MKHSALIFFPGGHVGLASEGFYRLVDHRGRAKTITCLCIVPVLYSDVMGTKENQATTSPKPHLPAPPAGSGT